MPTEQYVTRDILRKSLRRKYSIHKPLVRYNLVVEQSKNFFIIMYVLDVMLDARKYILHDLLP
jgi:hypothetical protein